jgi:hypothetical protein
LSAQHSRKLNEFRERYEDMPEDPHLFKGEGERRRRYARLLIEPSSGRLELFAHDHFFQAKVFDQLYGDMHRAFAPMTIAEYANPFFQQLIIESYLSLPMTPDHRKQPFEVSAHMIRIEATTASLTGRPAPEGVHRDGYHYGSIHLMRRSNVKGAINQVYDLQRRLIDQRTLVEPMDSIFFDDASIFHGVSPFQPDDPQKRATRDMLILLYQPLSDSPQKPATTKVLRHF